MPNVTVCEPPPVPWEDHPAAPRPSSTRQHGRSVYVVLSAGIELSETVGDWERNASHPAFGSHFPGALRLVPRAHILCGHCLNLATV